MSGNKSRLGKGLGALFPALPGEDALADASNNLQFNVSHETKKSESVDSQLEEQAKVSRETLHKDNNQSKNVSHETKVPSMSNSIAPHADKNNNKIKNVSRETVPSIHTNKHSHKRSTMPSLGDVTRPMDFLEIQHQRHLCRLRQKIMKKPLLVKKITLLKNRIKPQKMSL